MLSTRSEFKAAHTGVAAFKGTTINYQIEAVP